MKNYKCEVSLFDRIPYILTFFNTENVLVKVVDRTMTVDCCLIGEIEADSETYEAYIHIQNAIHNAGAAFIRAEVKMNASYKTLSYKYLLPNGNRVVLNKLIAR